MEIIIKAIKGCGYLHGYGDHPATFPMLIIALISAAEAFFCWPAALAMFVPTLFLYLIGGYNRYYSYERTKP